MIDPYAPTTPAIGACLSCRQIFLITPDTDRCLLCGRPPSHLLPFGLATPVDMTLEPPAPGPAPEALLRFVDEFACPHCLGLIEVTLSETDPYLIVRPLSPLAEEPAVEVSPPVAAGSPPEPEAEEAVHIPHTITPEEEQAEIAEEEAAAAAATPPRTDQPTAEAS